MQNVAASSGMSRVKLLRRDGLRTDGSNGQGHDCDAESSCDRSHDG